MTAAIAWAAWSRSVEAADAECLRAKDAAVRRRMMILAADETAAARLRRELRDAARRRRHARCEAAATLTRRLRVMCSAPAGQQELAL